MYFFKLQKFHVHFFKFNKKKTKKKILKKKINKMRKRNVPNKYLISVKFIKSQTVEDLLWSRKARLSECKQAVAEN